MPESASTLPMLGGPDWLTESQFGPVEARSTDGVYNYTYDAEGNRTQRTRLVGGSPTGATENYAYDHRGQLIGVTFRANPGGTILKAIGYRYDHENLLVRRVENVYSGGVMGTNTFDYYVHDGQQVIYAFHQGTSGAAYLTNRFLWGPEVDQHLADEQVTSLAAAGTVYYALADHLGTVKELATYDAMADTTSVVLHRVFDSFGNIVSAYNPSSIQELFAFTGKLWDATTGLQWNINRWYDPVLGQWISEDPIGFNAGDANLRRYVGNHPTYATDLEVIPLDDFESRRETEDFSVFEKRVGYDSIRELLKKAVTQGEPAAGKLSGAVCNPKSSPYVTISIYLTLDHIDPARLIGEGRASLIGHTGIGVFDEFYDLGTQDDWNSKKPRTGPWWDEAGLPAMMLI